MDTNGEHDAPAIGEVQAVPRSGLFAVLAAPWIAPFSADRAGRILAGAGPMSVVLALVSLVLTISAELTLIVTWDETRRLDYNVIWQPTTAPAASMPATATGSAPPVSPPPKLAEDAIIVRSFREVWSDSYELFRVSMGALVLSIVLFVLLYGAIGYLVVGVCTAPRFFDGCGIGRWAKTAAVAPLGGLWLVLPAVLAIGALVVVTADLHDRGAAEAWARGDSANPWWFPGLTYVAAILALGVAAIWALLFRTQRVGFYTAVTATRVADVPGVRCSGCGYSLEHVPDDGRCPECGADAGRSLSPDARPGLDWQLPRNDALVSFVRTSVSVLLRPSKAYGRMRTRAGTGRPGRFEVVQFIVATIATAAGLWSFLIADSISRGSTYSPETEDYLLGGMYALVLSVIGFLAHRLLAAVAIGAAAAKGEPADARALAGVVGYESVWVWAFFAWNFGVAFFLVFVNESDVVEWLRSTFGVSYGTASVIMPLAIFVVNVVLVLLWLYRYQIAYRAVRWANF